MDNMVHKELLIHVANVRYERKHDSFNFQDKKIWMYLPVVLTKFTYMYIFIGKCLLTVRELFETSYMDNSVF